MTRLTSILIIALGLTGCGKTTNIAPSDLADPITRFVAGYSNIQGSIIWTDVGAPSTNVEQALAKLSTDGVSMPKIKSLSVIEVRALRPVEPHLARRLTNSVAALVDTEIGQKIILLRQFPGKDEWSYHVFDSK